MRVCVFMCEGKTMRRLCGKGKRGKSKSVGREEVTGKIRERKEGRGNL